MTEPAASACYHIGSCEHCRCVQRAMRGDQHPCEHGGVCVVGCLHVEEAQARPEVRERIEERRCAEICAL